MSADTTLQPIRSRPEFADILRVDETFADQSASPGAERINGAFDRLLLQSGLRVLPSVYLGLCLLSGLALGGTLWVITESGLAAGFLFLVGMIIPVLAAVILRSRRQKAIMEQLPAMAEELARTARPGRSVESAFRIVAADTAAPLGEELRLAARRADMGLDLASAVQDLPQRTGVIALTMFTSAIALHQDTGGDLIQVLERLAAALRDRLHFTARLRAATIASRLGTMLMILVPVGVLLFYGLRDPLYFSQLLSSFWGRLSLGLAITLQVTGCVLAWQILKRSSRF